MVLGVTLIQCFVGVKVDFSVRRVGDDDAADLSAVRVADGFQEAGERQPVRAVRAAGEGESVGVVQDARGFVRDLGVGP